MCCSLDKQNLPPFLQTKNLLKNDFRNLDNARQLLTMVSASVFLTRPGWKCHKDRVTEI